MHSSNNYFTPRKIYPLKIDDWKMKFPFSMVPFRGSMLIFRRVYNFLYFIISSSGVTSLGWTCDRERLLFVASWKKATGNPALMQKGNRGLFVLRQNCYYERGHRLPVVWVLECWRESRSACCTHVDLAGDFDFISVRCWRKKVKMIYEFGYMFDMNDGWIHQKVSGTWNGGTEPYFRLFWGWGFLQAVSIQLI